MSKITITTKTPAQIVADFATVFKAIQPVAAAKPVTQADRLAPYRTVILKQRRRGLTWAQIATGMSQAPISEPVTEKLLKRIFGTKAKPATTAVPAAPVAGS